MTSPVFVDWLSMSQFHGTGLPVLNAGKVVAIGESGEVEYETHRTFQVVGSHDTKIRLRCDGSSVQFDGNVSRFNRPDNVFGLTYEEAVRKVNRILSEFGLPAFSVGLPMIRQRGCDRRRLIEYTGAVNTRIDVTKNFETGSDLALYQFITALSRMQLSRTKAGTKARDGSITWGEGSRYVYEILYDKARELERHASASEYVSRLVEWCRSLGIARYECKFKTRFLSERHLRFLGETTHERLVEEVNLRQEKLFACVVHWDTLNDIPKPYRATAKDWVDGVDVSSAMSLATFKRHRKFLQQFGLDIAMPPPRSDERERLIVPVKVEVRDAVAPDWYWSQSQERLAA